MKIQKSLLVTIVLAVVIASIVQRGISWAAAKVGVVL